MKTKPQVHIERKKTHIKNDSSKLPEQHRTEVTEVIKGRLSRSVPSTHKERLEIKTHLTGEVAVAAFVICECFHFWHLVKLAEANQVKDFPAARRLAPAYAQCSVPSFNPK